MDKFYQEKTGKSDFVPSEIRDVSFQAIAWIQAFMKCKFPHFYLFSACFGSF